MGRSLKETYEYLGPELVLWEAEYRLSPWGPERGDLAAGQVAQAVYATRGWKPPALRSFLLDRAEQAKPDQSETQAKQQCQLAASLWPKQ